MSESVRIFLSYDEPEQSLVNELRQQIQTAFSGREVVFWERSSDVFDERSRGEFLETASFSLIIFSSTYLQKGRNMLELEQARRMEREKRPKAPLYIALAEPLVMPEDLLTSYPVLPHPDEPIRQGGFEPARQLKRVAEYLKVVEARTASAPPQRPAYEKPYKPEDLVERLTLQLERRNLSLVFATLKAVVDDATLKQIFFELEDSWTEGIQACRQHKNLATWLAHNASIKEELQFRIAQITSPALVPGWRKLLHGIERGAQPGMGLFIPGGAIHLPETLYNPTAADQPQTLGVLNATQQQDYRRNLLLCQDALAVGNPERAFALADHLRTHINPISAQLYEYLLISYLQKETAERIVHEALFGQGRMFRHIVLFATRMKQYNSFQQCPTDSGMYNCSAIAEELSDALINAYDSLPNDHILDTGIRAHEVAESRPLLTRMLEIAQELFRNVHAYKGVLKILVNELSGGGKSNWVSRMEISYDGRKRFVPLERFDLESTVLEVLDMLHQAEPERSELLHYQLREDLYYSVLEKRQILSRQLEWEKNRYRKLTDERLSVIRLVQAALFGHQVFGDRGNDPDDQSFLRLAIEYLMPGLLLTTSPSASPDQPTYPLPMRWFDLDENGQMRAHPDNTRYRFDALAIVANIIKEQAGQTGWLQVQPNIHEAVVQQYVRDTDAKYAFLRANREYNDIRRLDDLEARREIIDCLRRWMTAYKAQPNSGSPLLDSILQELTGNRLLLWFFLNPAELATHPDSKALGYDAFDVLRQLLGLPISITADTVRQTIGQNLFIKTIEPAYRQTPPRDGKQRENLVFILLQALHAFRDLNSDELYLKLVYEEITNELKLPWIEVAPDGKPKNVALSGALAFDAHGILEQLFRQSPKAFSILEARRRIANRRHSELLELYNKEINDDRRRNGLPERRIAVEIIKNCKALFQFFPDTVFLELPIRELNGKGNIQWQTYVFRIFPIPQNHPENKILNFDYRQELAELNALSATAEQWMEYTKIVLGEKTV